MILSKKRIKKGTDQTARMLVCACVVRKPPKTGFLASRPIFCASSTDMQTCLFSSERDFMISLSGDNQVDIIDAFNTTSRYLDYTFNITKVYFDDMAGLGQVLSGR